MPSISIKVPDPAPGSFNHKRSPGLLLRSQTLHLREALRRHKKEVDALLKTDPKKLKTEGEVSSYIHQVTAILTGLQNLPESRRNKMRRVLLLLLLFQRLPFVHSKSLPLTLEARQPD